MRRRLLHALGGIGMTILCSRVEESVVSWVGDKPRITIVAAITFTVTMAISPTATAPTSTNTTTVGRTIHHR